MSTDVTQWLNRLEDGDPEALDHLVPLVYDELRWIARRRLRRESPGRTLQTTALVNEAYLRLLKERQIAAGDRERFFAVAGNVMRRILIDAARHRNRDKRAGGAERIPLHAVEAALSEAENDHLLDLDQALARLEKLSPRAYRVVEHRFLAGHTLAETAELLDVSRKTVQRDWITARAWLAKEIHAPRSGGPEGSRRGGSPVSD